MNSIQLYNKVRNFNFLKKFLLILICLAFIILAYTIYQGIGYEKTMSIDLNNNNFIKNNSLYIESFQRDAFDNIQGIYNNEVYRKFLGSPFALILNTKKFPINKIIKVGSSLRGNMDIEMTLFCPNCVTEKQYSYKNFYDGKFSKYNPAAQLDDGIFVYSAKGGNWINANNINDWLKNNVPKGSSVEIEDNVITKGDFMNNDLALNTGKHVDIATSLKGNHRFYVYLKNKMDLSIKNSHVGYNKKFGITLSDLKDNIIWEGDNSADVLSGQTYRFEVSIKKEGIYMLTISQPIDDFVISALKINSDKLLIDDSVVLNSPANIYTVLNEPKILSFFTLGSKRTITFKDETNKIINIAEIKPNIWNDVELKAGKYFISAQGNEGFKIKGNYFAFDKNAYFEPFIFDFNKKSSSSFIVTNKKITKGQDDWIDVEGVINKKELKQLTDKKTIQIFFRNTEFERKNQEIADFINAGFRQLGKPNGYYLLSKKSLNNANYKASDINAYLNFVIPKGGKLKGAEKYGFNYSAPAGYRAEDTIITKKLRGNHEFYLYLNDQFEAQIEIQYLYTYPNTNDLIFYLQSLENNKTVCSTNINGLEKIVKNLKCKNLYPGVYLLSIKDHTNKADFIINNLKVNTNKIVAKDSVLSLLPTTLYTNNNTDAILNFYYWHNNLHQDILFQSDKSVNKLNLSENDKGKQISYNLSSGNWGISPSKGNLYIKGSNFAFNAASWFNPNDYIADYVLITDEFVKSTYIKNFLVSLK